MFKYTAILKVTGGMSKYADFSIAPAGQPQQKAGKPISASKQLTDPDSNYFKYTGKDPAKLPIGLESRYRIYAPKSDIAAKAPGPIDSSDPAPIAVSSQDKPKVNRYVRQFKGLLHRLGWRPGGTLTSRLGITATAYNLDNARSVAYNGNNAAAQKDRKAALDARWRRLYENARSRQDVMELDKMYAAGYVPPILDPRAKSSPGTLGLMFSPKDTDMAWAAHMDDDLAYRGYSTDFGRQNYIPAGKPTSRGIPIWLSPYDRLKVFNEEAAAHPATVSASHDAYNIATRNIEKVQTTTDAGWPYEFSSNEGARALHLVKANIPSTIKNKSEYLIRHILSGDVAALKKFTPGRISDPSDVSAMSDRFVKMRNDLNHLYSQLMNERDPEKRARLEKSYKDNYKQYRNAVEWLMEVAPQAHIERKYIADGAAEYA